MNLEPSQTHSGHAHSVMRFCESMQDRYRELAKVGDMVTTPTRTPRDEVNAIADELVDLHASGMSVAKAARTLGMKPCTAYGVLSRRGIKVGRSPIDGAKVAKLRADGLKWREVAEIMECSEKGAQAAMQRNVTDAV